MLTKSDSNHKNEKNSCVNSSPLFLTLTAKCSSNNYMTGRHRICDIKQNINQYFDRNNIEIFNFGTESPDDCVRKLKTEKKGFSD